MELQRMFNLPIGIGEPEDVANMVLYLAFDEEWYQTAQELFPEWQSDPAAFDLALNLTEKLMEGIAISLLTHSREDKNGALRNYLEDCIRSLAPKSG